MTDTDLELGALSFPRSARTWSTRLTTGLRSSSIRSAETENSIAETLRPLTDEERRHQDTLLLFLVNDEPIKGVLALSCSWYCKYLRLKLQRHWHALRSALVGLDDNSTAPNPGDLVIVYSMIYVVAKLLKSSSELALVTIVDELDNDNFLKPQLDEERAVPNQIVFAVIGWLTMLYEAVSHPHADKLEVISSSTKVSGHPTPLCTRKYLYYKQGFDNIDRPLYHLVGKFGNLIPGSPTSLPHRRASETIKVQSISFGTLQSLADLKIEWVTSLALHLELDSGRKTLKLFQFPSYCRIMLAGEGSNVLSRVVNDHAASMSEEVTEPEVQVKDFLVEILLSYRVIFGQDERSWRAFSQMMSAAEPNMQDPNSVAPWEFDPLLQLLCAKDAETSEARLLYEDIDARDARSYYVPHVDFKFLGSRLLNLQDFSNNHQPRNIRELFNDRRDVAAWWTFWNNQVLIMFGSITLLLMILSLFFQIWQVILARQQLEQGSA